jgi:UDP-N-acetylmuramoyl-tripeptide--D-alanyl-D-alanine ligase
MGAVVARRADLAIVTDDNPRSEDPAVIRCAILQSCPGAIEIGDRAAAIEHAMRLLRDGDLLVIAGKGHEQGQTIGDTVHPFDDAGVARALAGRRMTAARGPLWTAPALAAAVRGSFAGSAPETVSGVSIDSRSLVPGDLFVALTGPNRDGHDFIAGALARGAAAALVARRPDGVPDHAPLLIVDDTQRALERIAAAARARTRAGIAAVTGSVGKTGTKEMLALALGGPATTHRSEASFNNQWGVPLSLARMPADAAHAVFEIGMNHAGEIRPLSRLVRPKVTVITTIEPAHLEFFDSLEAIADAKAEIFIGQPLDGVAVLNRDNPMFDRLVGEAGQQGIRAIRSFGQHAAADARLVHVRLDPLGSVVRARLDGRELNYRLPQPGRHLVLNSLAALVAAVALGADPERAVAAFARYEGLPGRGRWFEIDVRDGTATLIDESYNASPASVRAALAVLGTGEPGPGGRRIAVLGDMLELGASAPELHRALAPDVLAAKVDLVFLAGPSMAHLADALPADRVAGRADTAADLVGPVLAALGAGDIVMVKGSLGSRMAAIVDPLRAGLAARPPEEPAPC